MRYYETLYIANPNYEQDRLVQLMKNVANELDGKKVSIINHYIWSKKRLAYLIQKYKYGTFIILHFEAEKFNFLNESIYLALTPNKVIFSLSAIFIKRSFFLYIGNPSKRTIEAFDANELINQFHIIQPHVVK